MTDLMNDINNIRHGLVKLATFVVNCGLLLCGCQREADISGMDPIPDTSHPIGFSIETVTVTDGTRGMEPVTVPQLRDYGFGVCASYSQQDVILPFSGNAVNYFLEMEVRPVGDLWETTPISYWPIAGKLSFFAYAPYNVNRTAIQAAIPSADYVSGPLSIDYTPAENVSAQSDFCVSKPVYNRAYTGAPVPFDFRHTLCRVFFSFNYKHDKATPGATGLPAGTSLVINQIDITGVTGTRLLTYKDAEPFYEWGEEKGNSSYTLKRWGDDQIAKTTIPRTASGDGIEADITDSNGRLYLLPQTVNAGGSGDASITVTAAIVKSPNTESETTVTEFTVTKKLPETEWPAGGGVRYHVTLDLTTLTEIKLTYDVDRYDNWITPYENSNPTGTDKFHID